jgi:hypothetical protein
MAAGAAPSVSRPGWTRSDHRNFKKAAGFRRLFRYLGPAPRAGKTPQVCWTSPNRFAKRRPLAKAFPAGSGRIAQLVEQMTLNHRVPGSSPGAPTTPAFFANDFNWCDTIFLQPGVRCDNFRSRFGPARSRTCPRQRAFSAPRRGCRPPPYPAYPSRTSPSAAASWPRSLPRS